MPHSNSKKTLNDREIEAILAQFVQDDLTIEEAEEALDRLHAAGHRVTEKLLATLSDLSAEGRDTAVVLLGSLGDTSVVPGVLDLIGDESVDDDYKLKLISLIIQLDPSVDAPSLFDHLQKPYDALQRSQRELLQRLGSPSELALWLDVMEAQMPSEARAGFCRASTELGDAAAVPLLICMCYDSDDDAALAAIDAVERFKDARALSTLEELAENHPSNAVRTEARKATDRLRVRASLAVQVHPIPPAPLYACYLTTIDGSGGQVALIIRQHSDGTLELVDVMFNDHEGIKQCFGSTMYVDELEEMIDAFAEQNISPVLVSHGHCLAALDMACETTWKAGRLLPMSFVAWREVIEGGRAETEIKLPTLTVPPKKRDKLLKHCHELLLQDEFAFWFFNPDEIGQLDKDYIDLAKEADGTIDAPVLRELLRQGVREIVTDHVRGLIRGRLQRVAPLLRELYEDDEVWQWAVVAADVLAEDSPLPLDEHPLLLGIVACSLENVIGEQIEWLDAVQIADRRK